MKIINTPVLLAGLLGVFILQRGDSFFVDETKIDMEKSNGNGSVPVITIVKKWDMPKSLAEISGLSYIDGQRLPVSRMNWEKYLFIIPHHHQ